MSRETHLKDHVLVLHVDIELTHDFVLQVKYVLEERGIEHGPELHHARGRRVLDLRQTLGADDQHLGSVYKNQCLV